jgi:hypothetical protein
VFNPLSYPFLAVHTASYWALRYLVPFLLPVIFISSLILAGQTVLAWPVVAGQVIFYTAAMLGYLVPAVREMSIPSVAFSYCWANLGVAIGAVSFLTGTRLESY